MSDGGVMRDRAARHTHGLQAARRWAGYHIGDPAWADGIVDAYLNPDRTQEELNAEMSETEEKP